MLKSVPRNKWRLFVWIQAGVLAIVLIGFGTFAIAQNSTFNTRTSLEDGNKAPGMLVTSSPSATLISTSSPTVISSDTPSQGGAPQMDAKSKRMLDEMNQCVAASNEINRRIRELLDIKNSYYYQLQNFTYTPLDMNLTPDEQNSIRASDESRRQSIQAQLDAADSAERAYEATTPLASGHGMACWQGSGPYPQ